MHTAKRTPLNLLGGYENFTYRLFDANGQAKTLWKENKLGKAIRNTLRTLVDDPIAVVYGRDGVESSYVKAGLLNKLAAYGLRIPFITGHRTTELKVANLITNAGLAGVASRINGAGSEAAFTYVAIGTGTTAAAAGDTTLETEITTGGGARASATASRTTTTQTNDTATLVHTFTFSASFAVTEAGALNAASSGVLLNRQVFSAINVVSSDTLQVTIDVAVS